jgi:uncharacterized protein with HEPN domain
MDRDPGYLLDIVEMARRVERYVQGVDRAAFDSDTEKQDAVCRCLEVMGEATKRLSAEFRMLHPEIDWRRIAGMRDILIHDYDDINWNTVWEVATVHIPLLKPQLEALLKSLEGNDGEAV